ncbi:MAG: hypothetical protein RL591_1376 [Planctomycetota bacterium]
MTPSNVNPSSSSTSSSNSTSSNFTTPASSATSASASLPLRPRHRPSLGTLLARRAIWIIAVLCAAVALSAGYVVGTRSLSEERANAESQIETYVGVLTQARKVRDGRPELERRMQAVANRTLGPSLEVVDSEVRRRLNRVCEELGFTEFSVTTGRSLLKPSPAKREFRRPEERALRDEADFVEVEGSVVASGRPSQIYPLIYRIQAEPWTKRIESIRLDPSADGASLRMTLKLTTIFLPGKSANVPLVSDPQALADAQRYRALFESNPFRIPPPPAPVAPETVAATSTQAPTNPTPGAQSGALPVPAPASGFPYGEWLLTGIVEGPSGPEVWLRHLPTGSQLTLQPGSAIGELIFRRVEYDFGVFELPGGTCRVQVGSNLTQRSATAG